MFFTTYGLTFLIVSGNRPHLFQVSLKAVRDKTVYNIEH